MHEEISFHQYDDAPYDRIVSTKKISEPNIGTLFPKEECAPFNTLPPLYPDKNGLISAYILAKPGQAFLGTELLHQLLSLGLRFGDMFMQLNSFDGIKSQQYLELFQKILSQLAERLDGVTTIS